MDRERIGMILSLLSQLQIVLTLMKRRLTPRLEHQVPGFLLRLRLCCMLQLINTKQYKSLDSEKDRIWTEQMSI